jgi:tyrosyl-tRNA synthetase
MTQGAKPTPEMAEHKFKPVEEQLAYIKKGVAEIIPDNELVAKLENSRKTGKPLRVYLGVDPTAPDLHLGHTVVLRKLKHFQGLGHTAVFLIGDFSAMIGDPTGVSETRPPLTRKQVDANAKTYLEQVFKILDRAKTEVRYNSEWLSKMNAEDVVRLCSHYRLARMLEREDFRSRLQNNQPISVHELLYPLLTARDAVELKSDVELGATEQKFNLLVHREIQREYGLPGQAILTMPILVGLDGRRKMSKSLGNYVGITEPPSEMFGKLMSIPDDLMWSYWELVTDRPRSGYEEIRKMVAAGSTNPMDVKLELAREVVGNFHGEEAARKAADHFQRVFRDRQIPEELRQIRIRRAYDGTFEAYDMQDKGGRLISKIDFPLLGKEKWSKILAAIKESGSVSEAERLIKGGGLEVNNQVVTDPTSKVNLGEYGEFGVVIRMGKKKYFRLIIE